jgi:hypothetical protein
MDQRGVIEKSAISKDCRETLVVLVSRVSASECRKFTETIQALRHLAGGEFLPAAPQERQE